MHPVELRPTLASRIVPRSDETLETLAWLRHNTNRTASILAWPGGDAARLVAAAGRQFHLTAQSGANVPRRDGDRLDAAAVLLPDEERAWAVARALDAQYVVVRCSPLDTSEYDMTPHVDSSEAADADAAGARVNVAPTHLASPHLRLAQLAVDARYIDDMKAAMRELNQTAHDAAADSADDAERAYRPTSALAAAARPDSTSGSNTLLQLLCSARATRFRTLFVSLRGQYRVFRVVKR